MNGREILKELLADIMSRRFSETGRLPSEARLCVRFAASRMTVRGALAELQRRGLIEKRNGAGSFLTERARHRSGVIGLVIPDYAQFEFFSSMRQEIVRHCTRLNYRVTFVTTSEQTRKAAAADIRAKVRQLTKEGTEGVIFRPFVSSAYGRANQEIVQILREAKIPVVLIDADIVPPPGRSECDLVSVNNVEAGRRIAGHLRDRGYRRFAFLAPERVLADNANWSNRLFGLAGELALLGSEDGVHVLRFAPDDAAAIAVALRGRKRPDVIVCGNDECAIRLMRTLRDLGKRIPEDIAVVGFDDSSLSRTVMPPLTTISQPMDKIAEMAFKTLLARIRYPNNDPRETYLAAPLVIRAST